MTTLASYLLNQELPEKYQIRGEVTKKNLKEKMIAFAKEDPEKYIKAIARIKKLGDSIALYDGISVGLEDITPEYNKRDALLDPAESEIKRLKDKNEIKKKLLDVQSKGEKLSLEHPGTMGMMARSGGRGNASQIMKAIVSPITVKDDNGEPYPYLIKSNYAEGLTPAEYWLTAGEARKEVIRGQLSTAIPGDLSKQITATLNDVSITKPDCGTRNGIPMKTDDPQISDRYMAVGEGGYLRNTLITPEVMRSLQRKGIDEIIVRSPMTCLENPGVCQKCFGLSEKGRLQSLGTHIGIRSAQALAEPLTQMVLSSKHGVTLSKGERDTPSVEGVRQILEIPKSFKNKSVLSETNGVVTRITKAPQGGSYIHIDEDKYYADPKANIEVNVGDVVSKGDPLTSGIINPKELIDQKGLGIGRNYVVNTMYNFYKKDGVDIDKRHLELLARQNYNWVKITDPDSEGRYIPGDIVNYNILRNHLDSDSNKVSVTPKIIGEYLGNNVLFYTAGTEITPTVYNSLKKYDIKKVEITNKKPQYEYIVKPLEQIPLMSQDWIRRLGHRRLKDTILNGAAYGYKSPFVGGAPAVNMLYNPDKALEDINDNIEEE